MCPTPGSEDTAANKAGKPGLRSGHFSATVLDSLPWCMLGPTGNESMLHADTRVCSDTASAPEGEGQERLSTTLTFSSCSMQGVCTTILQAAHFLRGTDFCCRKERALRHQVTPARVPLQGQQRNPRACPSTSALCVYQEPPLLTPLTILRCPTARVLRWEPCSYLALEGLSSSQGLAYRLLDLTPPPGGSVLHTAHSPTS